MSQSTVASSPRTPAASTRPVTLPHAVAVTLRDDIARAHLALCALTKLLRNDALDGEEACLASLLGYIEDGLRGCDDKISQCMMGGDHA